MSGVSCESAWFGALCSGHGTCINSTCICEPGWSGNGPWYTVGSQDCSIYTPTIQLINYIAGAFSFIFTVLGFITVFTRRRKIYLDKRMISKDKIQILYFLQGFFGTILFFFFSRGYYVHSNYGIWVLLSLYFAVMLSYFFMVINVIIQMTYKLKHSHPATAKVTGLICLVGYITVIIAYLFVVIYANDYKRQLILIRFINAVFVVIGTYNSIAILYFGSKIENMLMEQNKNTNQEKIDSVRRIRYSFALSLLSFAMMIYPLFAIFPTLQQWAFSPGLAWGMANLYLMWHTKVIKKKIGTIKALSMATPKTSSSSMSPTTSEPSHQ